MTSAEPGLWRARAPRPAFADPVFFAPQGLGIGQLFVNGVATGRNWDPAGPHNAVYVPDLQPDSEWLLFDEDGRSPEYNYLFRDARVPTRASTL